MAAEYEKLVLNWKPPEKFTNGNRLRPLGKDLKEYRVYYGKSREEVKKHHLVVPPDQRSIRLNTLDKEFVTQTPVIYLSVTAVSTSEVESELSEIIFFLP